MNLFHQSRFADFDFNVGNGAEYIVVGGDYLVFSSAGIIQRISLVAPEKGSLDFWRIESLVEDEVTILYQGTFSQVEERFKLVKDRSRHRRECISLTSFKALLVVSLLTAVAACALVTFGQRHDLRVPVSSQDQIDFSKLVDAMKLSGTDYGQLLPSLAQRSEMSPEALRGQTPGTQQVVPELRPQSEEAVASKGPGNGLPKYSPDMYKEDHTLPVAVEKPSVSAPEAKQDKQVSEKNSSSTALENELANELQSELKKLSPDQAADVLRKVSMLTPGQLTGEALASLPPNIRTIIEKVNADNGRGSQTTPGITTADEKGVPTKIIMLPPSVVDNYRTHDGIASIPENSSWQARGNPVVHLPLPGGGDIQNVTDLERFGLKP